MDAIEPSNYEQAGWSDLTYAYVQSLRAAIDAANARAAEAERLERQTFKDAAEANARADAAEALAATRLQTLDHMGALVERMESAEAALKTAREAIDEITAVVGCLEGKDALDRELIRNIVASIALIKEPRP